MMETSYDVIVIGGGVVGCATARELSAYDLKIALLEKATDICAGQSRANTAIIHGGYDAKPGTLKAYYNVKGNGMFDEICGELDVPHEWNTSLVVSFGPEEDPQIDELYERGLKNGVPGLETIIPSSGIASWYDYTNSQGVPTIFDVSYANSLAGYNCGGTFLDNKWTVKNKEYGSWLWQIAQDQLETNGNYAPIWEESDYSTDWENIQCSALIVQGLNDFNVTSKQADLMVQAFEKAGRPWTLVLHQDGHNVLDNTMVNGELWNEILTRWLAF